MLHLRVKAPFAAFRTFTAGSYRPTAPFITPSSAYGLLLNIAGIESRLDDGRSLMTQTKLDLPKAELALGAVTFPEVQSIYQQLHNYPVGTSGKERADECKGAKYNIQPIRREFLSGIDAYVCIRGNDNLESQIRSGLQDGARRILDGHPRYGIPFLGDNSFMVDVIREESSPQPTFWYIRLTKEDIDFMANRCRLSVWINRADMSRTVAAMYTPLKDPISEIPELAWTVIEPPVEPPVEPIPQKTKRKKKK